MTQQPDNQVLSLKDIIKERADAIGKTLKQVALESGITEPTIYNIFKRNSAKTSQLRQIAAVLGISTSELLPGEASAHQVEDIKYLELPYIPVKARAGFVEMITKQGDYGYPETYRIVYDPAMPANGNVIIEVDGDSMDPYYPTGTKVRCKEIERGDWRYLNSGVYAISYANNFVIKRIKNNDYEKGYLMLHSDNTETGGSSPAPIEQIHCIYKVLRIVDAPAR